MHSPREPASSPCGAPPGYWGDNDAAAETCTTAGCCGPGFLKRGLLLFWAAWFTLVLATNVLDAIKASGVLPESWAFASGNYRYVAQTTARYGTPAWINALLFAGVISWEGIAAALFWRAGFAHAGPSARSARYAAFTTGLLLWGAFMLADEICIAYAIEAAH